MTKPLNETNKYTDIINKLDLNYKKIKELPPLPSSEVKYFLNEFSISTTYNSNAIEGNTFTYDETRLLIEKGITTNKRSFQEHSDIINYKRAFDFLYEALSNKTTINEDFIKKIHSFVLSGSGEAGTYRRVQNYIEDMFNIAYTPPSPNQVPSLMQEYVNSLNQDLNENKSILKSEKIDWLTLFYSLARHHILFERIHPFLDGNGRTGRLLLTYELILLGLLPLDINYKKQKHYYAALKSYDSKSRYSTRPNSKLDKMAKLLLECELTSTNLWLKTFENYL